MGCLMLTRVVTFGAFVAAVWVFWFAEIETFAFRLLGAGLLVGVGLFAFSVLRQVAAKRGYIDRS